MSERERPGEGLLASGALLAVVVLLLNDHLLKVWVPGVLTGKLSDAAGLVFFPLLLQGLVEVGLAAVGRYRGPSDRVLAAAIGLTAVVFTGVQLVPAVEDAWRWSLGTLQWPFRAALAALHGRSPGPVRPVASWADPTDLLTLPALYLAWRIGRAYAGRRLQP